jgi:hypothetical protein
MFAAAATEPGSADQPNEDQAMIGPDTVVVLDGQTVRTGTGCVHGVPWYVGHLGSAILSHSAVGPADALAAAIEATAKLHARTCDLSHPGTPSAAVGIVQCMGNTLRYLVLGDVTLILDTADSLRVISDDRVSRTARAERAAADAMPADTPEKAAALVSMKHAEIAARNIPGGYWIAAANPSAAQHALEGEIGLATLRRAVLLTDGAARAVTPFGLLDWRSALDAIDEYGPADLIRRVREAEQEDANAVRWPRNKISDDATVVRLDCSSSAGRPT